MAEEKKSAKDLDRGSAFEKEMPSMGEMPKSETEPTPDTVIERKEGAAEKDESYSKILSKIKLQTPAGDDVSIKADAQAVSAEESAEAKINSLVNLAMQKGVVYAVKVARHLEDNYTLDEMHDRLLADELHEALIKKGLIKE